MILGTIRQVWLCGERNGRVGKHPAPLAANFTVNFRKGRLES